MTEQMCKTCRFWLPSETSVAGDCRRFPPVFVIDEMFRFPVMMDHGWCGEWKGKTL